MTGPMDPLASYGSWAIGGTVALLVVFLLLRGRIRIEKGWGGFNVLRYSGFERFVHWLLALSFIVLALTGLGMRLGPTLLAQPPGDRVLAEALRMSKALHGMVSFAFMASLVLVFLVWLRHSLPHWRDAVWLLKGGGIVPGTHPPVWKFNTGQKLLFWLVVFGGILLSASGIAMLSPTQAGLFAQIVSASNLPGLQPLTGLAPQQVVQYGALWHGAAALVLICAVTIHICVRTIGIQGAFSAMGTGAVDANWARQHHRLWAEDELERMELQVPPRASGAQVAPAE